MPRLHEQPRATPDREVIRNAGLTGDDHIVLHLHAPGDPGLRHDQTARADPHVVRDVHQIVDLRARPDDGVIHAAAIDARIRADFDVVPDEAAPHMRNLPVLLTAFSGDVAEPVTPQYRPGVHDHALAQRRAGVERHARIQLRIVAHRHAVAQHTSRADADILAEGFQHMRHPQLAPQRVAIRADVAGQQEPLMGADEFNEARPGDGHGFKVLCSRFKVSLADASAVYGSATMMRVSGPPGEDSSAGATSTTEALVRSK